MGIKRTLKVSGLAAALVLALTGCMKMDMDLVLQPDDTVDGHMTIAVAAAIAELGEEDAESMAEQMRDDLLSSEAEFDEARVEPYTTDDFVGSTTHFEGGPLHLFAEDDEEALRFERVGDEFVVTGVMDMSDEETEQLESLGSAFDIRIAVTFPGPVAEHNGELDGNTVVWTPTLGERVEMNARGSANPGPGGGDSGGGDDGAGDDGATDDGAGDDTTAVESTSDGTSDEATDGGTVDDGTDQAAATTEVTDDGATGDAATVSDSDASDDSSGLPLIALIGIGLGAIAAIAIVVLLLLRNRSSGSAADPYDGAAPQPDAPYPGAPGAGAASPVPPVGATAGEPPIAVPPVTSVAPDAPVASTPPTPAPPSVIPASDAPVQPPADPGDGPGGQTPADPPTGPPAG